MSSKKLGGSRDNRMVQDDESLEVEQPYRQHFQDDDDDDVITQMLDKSNDKETEQRLVVRIVPQFIDYAIFGIQLTVLGSYFYVAYIWSDFGEVECRADPNSTIPLSAASKNQTAVNVSNYFATAIRWGFWMSFLTFLRAILA